jgi:hypothetical protein
MLGDRYSFSCRSRAQYGTLWVASIIQASVKIRKTLQMEHVGLLLWSDLQTSLHGWRCTCFCTATRRKNCLLLDSKAGGLDDRMDHRAHLAGLQVLSCEHRMVRYVHGLESTWPHGMPTTWSPPSQRTVCSRLRHAGHYDYMSRSDDDLVCSDEGDYFFLQHGIFEIVSICFKYGGSAVLPAHTTSLEHVREKAIRTYRCVKCCGKTNSPIS